MSELLFAFGWVILVMMLSLVGAYYLGISLVVLVFRIIDKIRDYFYSRKSRA